MALPGYDDPYGLRQSGLPPEMAGDARAIANRERIAKELIAQGMTPLGRARDAGRFVVAPHWMEGVAKLAQTYAGTQGLKKAEQGYRDLGERQAQMEAQAVQDYQRRKYGTPQAPIAPATPNDDEGNRMPSAQPPNVGADPRGAVESAMLSRFPALQKLGALDLSQLNRQEDRADTQAFQATQTKDAREARMQELQMRLADARTTAQDRAALQRELAQMQNTARQDMVRLAASLRPAPQQPQPRIIETAQGPMVLPQGATQAQAVLGPDGKPLGAKKGAAPLSATAQKELFEADDVSNSAANAIGILKSIITPDEKTKKSQNDIAYGGGLGNLRTSAMGFVPGNYEGENASVDLKNKVTGQALENLKVIFGGMPTEGERKILLDMQGSLDQTPQQRKTIFERAIELAERRQKLAQDKAKRLREGTYFGAGTATNQDGGSVLDQADAILRGLGGNR